MTQFQLYQGDCLELMSLLPDQSIDMILCDLPYGTTACSWDVVIPFEALWAQYKRIIRGNGAIVLTASQPFTSKLANSNLKWLKYEWIWEKDQGSNFANVKHQPFKVHENVLVFARGATKYYPQWTYGRPYAAKGRQARKRRIEVLNSTGVGSVQLGYGSSDGRRYPRSVLRLNRERGLHPTQKPVPLFEYLVKTYTDLGDLVLDNCMGSGTAGVACLRSGRRFIGMELDEGYFEVAGNRVTEARMQALS